MISATCTYDLGDLRQIGWEAVDPGASLTLCTKLPREDLEAKLETFTNRIMPYYKDRKRRPLQARGVQQ